MNLIEVSAKYFGRKVEASYIAFLEPLLDRHAIGIVDEITMDQNGYIACHLDTDSIDKWWRPHELRIIDLAPKVKPLPLPG